MGKTHGTIHMTELHPPVQLCDDLTGLKLNGCFETADPFKEPFVPSLVKTFIDKIFRQNQRQREFGLTISEFQPYYY